MVLNKWNFWESHPFTVASALGNDQYNAELQEASPLLERNPSFLTELGIGAKRSAGQMTFLIRPYDGFTSRLTEYAESSRPKPATVRVAIDGPYGKTLPLECFDKVLFVVGGSGIAVALSYLQKLTLMDWPGTICIHWAVQQAALAADILGCEMSCALNSERVQVNIYVTGLGNGAVSDEVGHRGVKCKAGRMDIEQVVEAALDAGEGSSLAVVACGPARMADDCRRAVVSRMLSPLLRIEYFEESFQ
ncbi:Ferric/cupric reductase transmembrane component B [Metarhizium anisopliae]|nr:Ferric/cupric reductase transmembrane component B [Metarhizium anisopliae]